MQTTLALSGGPHTAAQTNNRVLVPSTQFGLSESLKIQLVAPWQLLDTSAVPCSFQNVVAKSDRDKAMILETGCWPGPFLCSRMSCCLVPGVMGKNVFCAAALYPFPMETASSLNGASQLFSCICSVALDLSLSPNTTRRWLHRCAWGSTEEIPYRLGCFWQSL